MLLYYAGGALRLPSGDREASLARRRGTTIRFVDCSSFWHVEIIGKYFYFSSQAINVIIHSLAYPLIDLLLENKAVYLILVGIVR